MRINFDRSANRILIELLAEAERRMIEHGRCRADDVNQFLTLAYIERCATYHFGAAVYLPTEERLAAESFVAQLIGAGMKVRFGKHVGKCAVQLANHTSFYFPDYETLLEMQFMAFMASKPTLLEMQTSGLLRQAVAALPRELALKLARREFRRLGLNHDKLLIIEDISIQRIE
ncbi:hypothetical protein [Sphingobium fuliginis]|uniref:hypothetical protein n=1 Tax=Sphingobium fuliginis (strain ATCC 27551) TaxID=336203 RepID=UPI000C07D8FF|nr:hypothetical protein [Sphingobium fuliginis]